MIKNIVSFILSFVILMEKCGFSGSPLRCARQNCVIQCSSLSAQCLMEDKHSWKALDQAVLPHKAIWLVDLLPPPSATTNGHRHQVPVAEPPNLISSRSTCLSLDIKYSRDDTKLHSSVEHTSKENSKIHIFPSGSQMRE